MPIVSVPQSVLFNKLGRVYSDKEFEELCFQYGLELDEITSEKDIVAKEQGVEKAKSCSTELVFKIEVPANRHDLLCAEGLARSLRIFTNQSEIPFYRAIFPKVLHQVFVKPAVHDVRPFLVAAILRDINLSSHALKSLMDLQEKLHQNICRKRSLVAIGIHDLDKVKSPFFYDAVAPQDICFTPLNKSDRITGVELMSIYAVDSHLKQYLPLIQDKPKYPLLTDSTGIVLSLPPIINGEHSRVTTQTRNLFIDATGTDLHKAVVVLDTIVTMFSEYCQVPFTVEPVEVIHYDGTKNVFPRIDYRDEVISIDYVNRLLGTQLSEDQIASLLNRMGLLTTSVTFQKDPKMGSKPDTSGLISVRVPPTRHDILHACDIAEDVAIAYGYDNIPEHSLQTCCIASTQPINKLTDLVRMEIALLGFTEALSFSLCSKDDVSTKLRHNIEDLPVVFISNPKTVDFQVVRNTLLPGLLHTIANNRRLSLPIKLFEVQDIIVKDSNKDVGASNHRHICAIYYNKRSGFEIIHGLLDRLMKVLQIDLYGEKSHMDQMAATVAEKRRYRLKQVDDPTFFPGRCADVILDPGNIVIGRLGVIHPDVLRNFDLSMPCSALNLNLEIFL